MVKTATPAKRRLGARVQPISSRLLPWICLGTGVPGRWRNLTRITTMRPSTSTNTATAIQKTGSNRASIFREYGPAGSSEFCGLTPPHADKRNARPANRVAPHQALPRLLMPLSRKGVPTELTENDRGRGSPYHPRVRPRVAPIGGRPGLRDDTKKCVQGDEAEQEGQVHDRVPEEAHGRGRRALRPKTHRSGHEYASQGQGRCRIQEPGAGHRPQQKGDPDEHNRVHQDLPRGHLPARHHRKHRDTGQCVVVPVTERQGPEVWRGPHEHDGEQDDRRPAHPARHRGPADEGGGGARRPSDHDVLGGGALEPQRVHEHVEQQRRRRQQRGGEVDEEDQPQEASDAEQDGEGERPAWLDGTCGKRPATGSRHHFVDVPIDVLIDCVGSTGRHGASQERGCDQPERRDAATRQDHRRHGCDQEKKDDPRFRQLDVGGQSSRGSAMPVRTGSGATAGGGGLRVGWPEHPAHGDSSPRSPARTTSPGTTLEVAAVATTAPHVRLATATWATTAAGASFDQTLVAPISTWTMNSRAAPVARTLTGARRGRSRRALAATTTTRTPAASARTRWAKWTPAGADEMRGTSLPFIRGQSGKTRPAPSPRT